MKTLIATTEGRTEGKITTIKRTQLAVWTKLKEVFGDGFYVDTFYRKIRVTTSNKNIVDFFENPYKLTIKGSQTEIIL